MEQNLNTVQLKYMTAEELTARVAAAPAVILPIGSMEILGKHGPLGLDSIAADAAAQRIAERSGALVAPTIPYGDTLEFCHMDGTVHVPESALEAYLYAVAHSLLTACHAKAVVLLTAHSLNGSAATSVCRKLTAEGFTVGLIDWWPTVGSVSEDILTDSANGRGHGAEMITSVSMAVAEEWTHPERAANETPLSGLERVNRWNGTPFRTFGTFPQYCVTGAWGNTAGASAEKGRILFDRATERAAAFIREAFANQ